MTTAGKRAAGKWQHEAMRRFWIIVRPDAASTLDMLTTAFAPYPRFTVRLDQRQQPSSEEVRKDRRVGGEHWSELGFSVCERQEKG